MISEHAILGHLAQLPNWGLHGRGSLAAGWHAIFKGRLNDYNVYLSVSEDWFYMQCVVLRANIFPECRAALYDYLLRANDRMFMAKFALARGRAGRGDCVTLVAECSVDNFNSVAALLDYPARDETPPILSAGEYRG